MNKSINQSYPKPPTVASVAEALRASGQTLSAVLDHGLRAYPLRDMLELPSRRGTATQDHPTTLG